MAKTTRQWVCITILTLLWSTLAMAHVIKPPPRPGRLRKLQMYKNSVEPETNHNFRASDSDGKTAEHHHPQMDKTDAKDSSCGGGSGGGSGESSGVYGGGHGSGGTTFGFRNIFPFPAFPFGGVVPEVSTWGEGDGYGRSNTDSGTGVSCQCSNGYPMHYVISPVQFRPVDTTSLNRIRRDKPDDMAPIPKGN